MSFYDTEVQEGFVSVPGKPFNKSLRDSENEKTFENSSSVKDRSVQVSKCGFRCRKHFYYFSRITTVEIVWEVSVFVSTFVFGLDLKRVSTRRLGRVPRGHY